MNNKELKDKQLLEEAIKGNITGFYERLKKAFDCESEEYDEDYYIFEDILDIKIISSFDKNILGVIYTIALGGPNIYIDTYNNIVKGCWGNIKIIEELDYYFNLLNLNKALLNELDDYTEELFQSM